MPEPNTSNSSKSSVDKKYDDSYDGNGFIWFNVFAIVIFCILSYIIFVKKDQSLMYMVPWFIELFYFIILACSNGYCILLVPM